MDKGSNYINSYHDTAQVTFKRPFKSEGTEYSVDLIPNSKYRLYMSNFVGKETDELSIDVDSISGSENLNYLEIEIMGPELSVSEDE